MLQQACLVLTHLLLLSSGGCSRLEPQGNCVGGSEHRRAEELPRPQVSPAAYHELKAGMRTCASAFSDNAHINLHDVLGGR